MSRREVTAAELGSVGERRIVVREDGRELEAFVSGPAGPRWSSCATAHPGVA
ncbi:MAG: hypothetical protein ACXVR1_10005 [Solirubrobacteraceae bacterium]